MCDVARMDVLYSSVSIVTLRCLFIFNAFYPNNDNWQSVSSIITNDESKSIPLNLWFIAYSNAYKLGSGQNKKGKAGYENSFCGK